MRIIIPIQNISDIITNSSSEIFVCKTDNPEYTINLLREVLSSVYDNLKKANDHAGRNTFSYYGETIDDLMTISIASHDFKDSNYNYEYKKGDVIIESTDDNSIPDMLMQFIWHFFKWDECKQIHLG